MNRNDELKIKTVFVEHIRNAVVELGADGDPIDVWFGEGFDARLAEVCVQTIAMMQESCEAAKENEESKPGIM